VGVLVADAETRLAASQRCWPSAPQSDVPANVAEANVLEINGIPIAAAAS